MKPWTMLLARLGIAGACVMTVGCGNSDVPDPGAGDEARAIERSHLGHEKFQDFIDRLTGDDAFFDEQRLQRFRALSRLRRQKSAEAKRIRC